jgi:hypothetical protein
MDVLWVQMRDFTFLMVECFGSCWHLKLSYYFIILNQNMSKQTPMTATPMASEVPVVNLSKIAKKESMKPTE